jgi:hypothetical protein
MRTIVSTITDDDPITTELKALKATSEPRKTLIIPFEIHNDDIIADGDYHAVCTGVFDCGTHDSKVNKDKKVRMVVFEWVLPDLPSVRCPGTPDDDTPRTVYRRFVAELRERTPLSTFLTQWLDRRIGGDATFDLGTLSGKPAVISIEGDPVKGMRNRVIGIKPNGQQNPVCPLQVCGIEGLVWSIEDAQCVDDFGHLPKMARDMCMKSYEAKAWLNQDGNH